MVKRISRKIPYLNNLIAKEFAILNSLQSKVISQDVPKISEERFALFLLKWLKKTITPDFLDSKFKQLNEKGIFCSFNADYENNSDHDKQSFHNNLIISLFEVSSLNILNKKQLKNITNIIQEIQNDKSKISPKQYEALLFLEYCHTFSSISQWKGFTNERLLIYVRILKQAIEKASLLSKAKKEIKSQMIHTQPDEDFFRSYFDFPSEPENNLKRIENFFNDFFRITDVCLDYQEWKSIIHGIKFFEERLWLSLYIKPHQCSDTKLEDNVFGTNKTLTLSNHLNLTKERQIVSMLYYWYYGLFEGGYADIFFNILHNEPDSRESNAFLRLFVSEQDSRLKQYIRDRYAIYCSKGGIDAPKQIECLKGYIKQQGTGGNTEHNIATTSISQTGCLKKPKEFNDDQIKYLSRLLANRLKIIDVNDQEYISYFLGGEGKSLPIGKLISWKESRHSLKYFIKCYINKKKLGNTTWQTVADCFQVKVDNGYKQFPNSTSYSNLSTENTLKGMEKELKNGIDDCISEAKKN